MSYFEISLKQIQGNMLEKKKKKTANERMVYLNYYLVERNDTFSQKQTNVLLEKS